MSARRPAVAAVVLALLAMVLWWLSRDVIVVEPPEIDPSIDGTISRTVTTTWLLLAATLAAGLSMVCTTQAILRFASRTPR